MPIKEKPIIFNAEMIRSIMGGRKTQTRRIKKSEKSPYGASGDQLWVREAAYISQPNFCDKLSATHIDPHGSCRMVGHVASMDEDSIRCAEEYGVKKSPSIFMPRWASRIQLSIVGVKTQELQAISEDDACAEGITRRAGPYILDFANLWDEINGKAGKRWCDNPEVWVIEFGVHWINSCPNLKETSNAETESA